MYRLFIALLLGYLGLPIFAQGNFVQHWEQRVRETSSKQPGWAVPVITPSSSLSQLIRFDAIRQYSPAHATTWNIDGNKGFDFIPWHRTEVDINLPPLLLHSARGVRDGAGDLSTQLKYRLAAGNEKHGNYSASVALVGTAPTGSYKNGASDGTIAPTALLGKGVRSFDVQSAASIALPTGHTAAIGRPIAWNTALQQKIGKIFWPAVEINTVFYRGGPRNGKTQTFVTPAFEITRIKLKADPKNRLALLFGVGEQIAVTHFQTYNHELAFTTRINF